MTIAVQISLTGSTADHFNYRCFTILAALHPGVHFVFIYDRPFNPAPGLPSNITPVLVGPQMRNGLLHHYWYQYKLPGILNHYNAAMFISSGSSCSLRSDTQQCITISDLSGFEPNGQRYMKKFIRRFIGKATKIVVPNIFMKDRLSKLDPQSAEKLTVILPGTDSEVQPLPYNKKEEVKKQYAGGPEFFILHGAGTKMATIITVLKAFSHFKKWQKSNMQLLIIPAVEHEQPLQKTLLSYKYREDVKLLSIASLESSTTALLLSSAYAAIFLPDKERLFNDMLVALQTNTPVILPEREFYSSGLGDAAAYTAENDKAISQMMILLYKDEDLRNRLIGNGRLLTRSLEWEKTAVLYWKTIIAPSFATVQ